MSNSPSRTFLRIRDPQEQEGGLFPPSTRSWVLLFGIIQRNGYPCQAVVPEAKGLHYLQVLAGPGSCGHDHMPVHKLPASAHPVWNPHRATQLPYPPPFLSTSGLSPSLLGPCKPHLRPPQGGLLSPLFSERLQSLPWAPSVGTYCLNHPWTWKLLIWVWSLVCSPGRWSVRSSALVIVVCLRSAENLVSRRHLLP